MKLQFRIYKLKFDKIHILPKDNTCHHTKGLIPLFQLHLSISFQIIYRFLLQTLSSLSFQTDVAFDVIHSYGHIISINDLFATCFNEEISSIQLNANMYIISQNVAYCIIVLAKSLKIFGKKVLCKDLHQNIVWHIKHHFDEMQM